MKYIALIILLCSGVHLVHASEFGSFRMPQLYAVCPGPKIRPPRPDTSLKWMSRPTVHDEEDRKLNESVKRSSEQMQERRKQEREAERQKQRAARLAILKARNITEPKETMKTVSDEEMTKLRATSAVVEHLRSWLTQCRAGHAAEVLDAMPVWTGGDVTAIEDVEKFNTWFYEWKKDEGIAEGLDTWGKQHAYFKHEIERQLYLLNRSLIGKMVNKTEYDVQVEEKLCLIESLV